uniref:Uncharacterized protein n=1 Tax=uncultured prokaryote TaxID=198431 RepID=A0A0H5Q406_9ZZZZ|nr:hypothetical protein [uncultured prokaryote]
MLYSWDFYSIESPRNFLEVCRELSKEKLKKGYMPLEHQLRNGESCTSFYRGPFVPAASEAGTADVSRAAARELGRLLAMKNQPAASELLRLRQHNKRALHKKEQKQMLQRNGVASGRRGGSWLLKILEEKGDELL